LGAACLVTLQNSSLVLSFHRTAFETVEAVSFYTIFLLGYIRYRNGEFRWLYVSLVSAAMAF
jgi:hypothetical protein